jgi:putative methyltransferase
MRADRITKLRKRLSGEGVHFYTELILGLPLESRDSFTIGLTNLFEAGFHEDVRVYELMILPNAPINSPTVFELYGLRTIKKLMHRPLSGEDESCEIVVQTNTMSRDDWVHCMVFSQLVQILHNGCLTRYLAIHLRRARRLSYHEFYSMLLEDARQNPVTVLGELVASLQALYERYVVDSKSPHLDLIESQPNLLQRVERCGSSIAWTPDKWGWMCVAQRLDHFYSEIEASLQNMVGEIDEELEEVSRFQEDIILSVDYDPQVGKLRRYSYDLPKYFQGYSLIHCPISIQYRDTHMGINGQYPLERGHLQRYAKAAVGDIFPIVRARHFQHQLDTAAISYMKTTGS